MSEENVFSIQGQNAVWDLLRHKPNSYCLQMVQLEVKQDKYENRILVAADNRLFFIKSKPLKVDFSISYRDITVFHSSDVTKLTITVESKQYKMIAREKESFITISCHFYNFYILNNSFPPMDVVYYSSLPKGLMLPIDMPHLLSPCGNLSSVYKSKCDQMGLDFHEDVAWDIDAIYNSHSCFELNLSDFDHLTPKHLIPLLSSLEKNTYFTKLTLPTTNTANKPYFTPELQSELLKVLKENKTLQEINFSNTGIKSDFLIKLGSTLASAPECSINNLDFSNNNLDDKGIAAISPFISNKKSGMKSLNFSKASLTSRGINSLVDALQSKSVKDANFSALTRLDFSGNQLKEEPTILHSYLAQPNQIEELRLADTETPLDNFFAASLRGCTQNLKVLDLSGCSLSQGGKKSSSSSSVPISWRQFFSSVSSLKQVNLSNNKLPPDAYKYIFDGLEENTVADGVELNFSNCGIGLNANTVQVFELSVARMTKVSALDLTDNGFDQSLIPILNNMTSNKHLKKLCLGKNLANAKQKTMNLVAEALISVIQEEGSVLESLSIDNMKMKAELMPLINAMGTNSSLTYLDISGNQIGDFGAKMLSKALQINKKLNTLILDNNQFSFIGFEHLASSLERNTTLKFLPLPLCDIASTLKVSPDRTEKAVRKIEFQLRRNISTKQLHNVEAQFRLQQWIFNNFDQETFNRNLLELYWLFEYITELKEKGVTCDEIVENKLKNCREIFFEARRFKDILLDLHKMLKDDSNNQKSIVDGACNSFLEKVENCMNKLSKSVSKKFEYSLKPISKENLFQTHLTSKEKLNLIDDFKSEFNATVTSLVTLTFYEKSVKYADFLLCCITDSLDQALLNTKSIWFQLVNQMVANGKLAESDPQCQEIRYKVLDNTEIQKENKLHSANEFEAAEAGRRLSSKKMRTRPASSLSGSGSSTIVGGGHIGTPSYNRTSLGQHREVIEPLSINAGPIPKPRVKKLNKKCETSSLSGTADDSDSAKERQDGSRDGSRDGSVDRKEVRAESLGLDAVIPPACDQSGSVEKLRESVRSSSMSSSFVESKEVAGAAEPFKRSFGNNLIKSASHDVLDESSMKKITVEDWDKPVRSYSRDMFPTSAKAPSSIAGIYSITKDIKIPKVKSEDMFQNSEPPPDSSITISTSNNSTTNINSTNNNNNISNSTPGQPRQSTDGPEPVRLESVELDWATPKLTHLCKSRPRRPGTRAPTRASMKFEEENADVFDDPKTVDAEDSTVATVNGVVEGAKSELPPGKKLKKESPIAGIATGLKSLFNKRSPSSDFALTSTTTSQQPQQQQQQPQQQQLPAKATNFTAISQEQHNVKAPAPNPPSSGKQSEFSSEIAGGVLKKKVFEESTTSAVVESSAVAAKPTGAEKSGVHSSTPTAGSAASGETGGVNLASSAPVPGRRMLVGARPGLGQVLLPTQSEIQKHRLSMKPINQESMPGSEVTPSEDLKKTNAAEHSSGVSQKVKPPPPLAPKPSLRNSVGGASAPRPSSGSVSEQENIGDDPNSQPAHSLNIAKEEKTKDQDAGAKKDISYLEEFRRKQEKNKQREFSKM